MKTFQNVKSFFAMQAQFVCWNSIYYTLFHPTSLSDVKWGQLFLPFCLLFVLSWLSKQERRRGTLAENKHRKVLLQCEVWVKSSWIWEVIYRIWAHNVQNSFYRFRNKYKVFTILFINDAYWNLSSKDFRKNNISFISQVFKCEFLFRLVHCRFCIWWCMWTILSEIEAFLERH